jgi:hypothetical protein
MYETFNAVASAVSLIQMFRLVVRDRVALFVLGRLRLVVRPGGVAGVSPRERTPRSPNQAEGGVPEGRIRVRASRDLRRSPTSGWSSTAAQARQHGISSAWTTRSRSLPPNRLTFTYEEGQIVLLEHCSQKIVER